MFIKPSNQKPAGLLRTPIYAQRYEVLPIDLFGPLPESPTGKMWIMIVEDTSTKWVELFALHEASAVNCAKTLLEEVVLRYGLPRRLISDNGPQFISAVMQQLCHLLGITQDPTPYYHPQAHPCERKNRDLKPRLAILVGKEHKACEGKLYALIKVFMRYHIGPEDIYIIDESGLTTCHKPTMIIAEKGVK